MNESLQGLDTGIPWRRKGREERRERGIEGKRERGRDGEEKKIFRLFCILSLCQGTALQGIVCGCSVLERGEKISKSRSWNQHHRTLNLHHLRSLGSTNGRNLNRAVLMNWLASLP